MSLETDTQLRTDANVIRNETLPNANTATRIGNFLLNLIDSKPNSGSLLTVWTFPAGAYPTATAAGQQWYTNAEYSDSNGFTWPVDTLLISKAAGTGSANFLKKQG